MDFEFLKENGILLGRYNVYYANTKCVNYSYEYYLYDGKEYQVDHSAYDDVYEADFKNDYDDLDNLFGFTEEDGYWEVTTEGESYLKR